MKHNVLPYFPLDLQAGRHTISLYLTGLSGLLCVIQKRIANAKCNHDTYDEHENVLYAVVFRVLRESAISGIGTIGEAYSCQHHTEVRYEN